MIPRSKARGDLLRVNKLWRYRLARPRTSASQAEYTGSNPVSATVSLSIYNNTEKDPFADGTKRPRFI